MSDLQATQTVVNCLELFVLEKRLWRMVSQLSKYIKTVSPQPGTPGNTWLKATGNFHVHI